jgi:hypothetical protein
MGKVKHEPLKKQTNRFAALADSDSDEEISPEDRVQTLASPGPRLQALESLEGMQALVNEDEDDPPYAPPSPPPEVDEAPQYRVWKNDPTRFSSENNIFSSPFSRKTKKTWSSIEIDSTRGDDTALAKAWAAKINVVLDAAKLKAEKDRQFHKNNMSFFRTPVLRRTVVLDEKF